MTPIGDPMTRSWEEFVEGSPYWLKDDEDLEAELARDEAAS